MARRLKDATRGQNVGKHVDLEYPYNTKWKRGNIVASPDGRETLCLSGGPSKPSSTQYSRYLLAVHLGRFLEPTEHVDHIDGNRLNNVVENLQILTLAENNIKSNKRPDIELTCPVCGQPFKRARAQIKTKEQQWRVNHNQMCCSRICAARKAKWTIEQKLASVANSKVQDVFPNVPDLKY